MSFCFIVMIVMKKNLKLMVFKYVCYVYILFWYIVFEVVNIKTVLENHKKAIACIVALGLLVTGTYCISGVSQVEVIESSIVGLIVGALVGVVVAVALIPTIANQTATLETNADLDTSEQTLVGLWPLFIIVGVMMAIIGMAL